MPLDRFRALSDRCDALLVARLGDKAVFDDGRTVYGDFTSPFVGAEIGGGKAGSARLGAAINADEVFEPNLNARSVDVVGVEKGAFLTIELPVHLGGGRYKVSRVKPDGSGMTDLVLSTGNERTDDIT